jgi:Flp pilus assembly protein TadD
VALLAVVAALCLAELNDLRGELAFARYRRLARLAEMAWKAGRRAELASAVQQASAEAELIMRFARQNPDALRIVAATCVGWSGTDGLDPLLRLRLAEKAAAAAGLAVRAAPSDYELWLWLARSQFSLGLGRQAQACLRRAQQLAPPGMSLELVPARQ